MLSIMDLQNLALRPNCLLTPSALIFVPGPRSLFFYANPFAMLPGFLFEHGYRTQVLSLPFRNRKLRSLAFQKWLKEHRTEKFHFIMPENTYQEFKNLIPQSQISSVTALTEKTDLRITRPESHFYLFTFNDTLLKKILVPIHYRMHQLYSFLLGEKSIPYSLTFSNANRSEHERFLDHCIKLAENEIYA